MVSDFKGRDVITIRDFTRDDILTILSCTHFIKKNPQPRLLDGFLLGSCFYEPSTRTRLSFDAAMLRLGGQILGFTDSMMTSAKKGESLHDAMKMVEQYVDLIVLRHPLEGAAQWAADTVAISVVNAGDGAHQHPTQTFLDLFTIQECQGTLDGLHIALVGDLKYGRTIHSLTQALMFFNARLYLISPESLELPREICEELRNQRIKFSFHKSLSEIIHKIDILYMTRIQAERFSHQMEYEAVKNSFILKPEQLQNAKNHLKILHPLPRIHEISQEVDETPYAYYFQQASNGLYTRQALLGLILGKLAPEDFS